MFITESDDNDFMEAIKKKAQPYFQRGYDAVIKQRPFEPLTKLPTLSKHGSWSTVLMRHGRNPSPVCSLGATLPAWWLLPGWLLRISWLSWRHNLLACP